MNNIIKWAKPVIQTVISALLLYMLISCGLLPAKYLGIAIGAVIGLLLITYITSRSDSFAARSFGTALALIVCLILVFAAFYLRQIVRTLDQISGTNTEINSIVVAVVEGNPVQNIGETAGYTFGVQENFDEEIIKSITDDIIVKNGDSELKIIPYDSVLQLAQALLNNEVDAVIYNNAYLSILDDALNGFSTQTKIIYEKTFEYDIENIETNSEKKHVTIERGEGRDTVIAKDISLTEDSYTILISGIDVSGPINTTSRSDVNILMSVNPKTHKILLTTTPRDYFVIIPGVSGESRDKLTHAGIYGVRTSMRTLENLYGIDISNYIRINFDSLIQLVDTLDGVDVESEYEFDSAGFHFVRGANHLNGEQALAFSRSRSSFEEGDNQRGKNQMMVLTAILNKLQSPALLKNPAGILDVVGRSMQTSIPTAQITKIISWQLDNPQKWDISRQAVIGTGDTQQTYSMPDTSLYVMWPDEDSVKNAAIMINKILE